MTGTPRQLVHQAVHFMRKTVLFGDTNISTGVLMGTVPAGSVIIDAVVVVKTAFNAGSTNVLTAGSNSTSYDNIVGAGDVTEATPGGYRASVTTAAQRFDSDTDIYARYTQSGGAATTGEAEIVITFVPDTDG